MVSKAKRDGNSTKTFTKFDVIFEPVFLREEDDNERIKYLAEQILECIESAKKCSQTGRNEQRDELFGSKIEKVLGL